MRLSCPVFAGRVATGRPLTLTYQRQQSTVTHGEAVQPWASSPLRWAGSKKSIVPILLSHIPATYRRYIEPFAGSACVFFALHPATAILNDRNPELMNFYEVCRMHPRRLSRAVTSYPTTADFYYHLRDGGDDLSRFDRAARFLYLNRFCFNGVWRENRQGRFNVPRGRSTGNLPSESHLYRCSVALRTATLVCDEFDNVVGDIGPGDFLYLDPPYSSVSRSTYGEYGYGAFGRDDIPRLVNYLMHVDRKGAIFLLSYSTELSLGPLPPQWTVTEVCVRRHIAGFADGRRTAIEVLITNHDRGTM